jgi:hypothetical protein
MKPQCIDAISKAAGKAISPETAAKMEGDLLNEMRKLAREDIEAWRNLSPAERHTRAAKAIAERTRADADRKAELAIRDAKLQLKNAAYVADRAGKGDLHLKAVDRILAPSSDMVGGIASLDKTISSIFSDLFRGLDSAIKVTGKFGGLLRNADGYRALVKELFREESGVPEAKTAAHAIRKAGDSAREQFNDLGGRIGELEEHAIPQYHDAVKVQQAGKDAWVADIIGKLDRSRYVTPEGALLDDVKMAEFLSNAWESIAWNGVLKKESGAPSAGISTINKGSFHRQLHFKDADAYLAYQDAFGSTDPMSILSKHFHGIAKDIALVKTFGSNPQHAISFMLDEAYKADARSGGKSKEQLDAIRYKTERLYDTIVGKSDPIASSALKAVSDKVMSLQVASKLASATIAALCDQANLVMAAHAANIPVMKIWRAELSAFNLANSEEKVFARRQGLMHESFTRDINRWGMDTLGTDFASQLANTTIRASGLDAITQAAKRSWGVAIYDIIGGLSRKHADLSSVPEADRSTLDRAGVTAEDFSVWTKAETLSRNGAGDTLLTPDAIYAIPDAVLGENAMRLKRDAAQKLIATALLDVDVAVPTPGARTRALLSSAGMGQRGTVLGEISRQLLLFKATPIAMFQEQWGRMMSQPGVGNKFTYAAKYVALTTFMGAFANIVNDVVSGKDPKDFTENPLRVGASAVLKGGALGFMGDFLFADTTLEGNIGAGASMAGPTMSSLEQLARVLIANPVAAARGEETNFGRDAAKFAKGMMPFGNMWYAKAAFNHLWMLNVQDVLQPGYSRDLERRSQREFGQDYWWSPGEAFPDRAPNLGAAVGVGR